MISKSGETQLKSGLDSLKTILTISPEINKKLGSDKSNAGLIVALKNKLGDKKEELSPHTRVSLLQTLHLIQTKYQSPAQFLTDFGLTEMIQNLAQKDSSMLVKNVAKILLDESQKH